MFTAPNSEIIQEYSEPCVNSGIFRTLVYLESWHIQNQRHTQNPVISRTLAHSEPETYSESWIIQNPELFRTGGILRTLSKINNGVLSETANGYDYFRKS